MSDSVVVLGPSGSGKTTYLHEQRSKCQHSIYCDCTSPPLIPYLNTLENCALVSQLPKVVVPLAQQLEIEHLLRRPISKLSRGEAQRSAVLRELLRPNYITLLLDEPTSSLDERLSFYVMKAISDRGNCIVATHDVKFQYMFDEVIELEDRDKSIPSKSVG